METLRRGSENVHVLITALRNSGFNVSQNYPNFGLEVEAAVRCFQEYHQIKKDGIVGKQTWDKLLRRDPIKPYAVNPIQWVTETPYYPQRDNEYNPHGTCNVTCLAMVLSHHGYVPAMEKQLEDELYLRLQEPDAQAEFVRSYPSLAKQGYKPRHIHGMLRWLAQQYDFYARFDDDVMLGEMTTWGQQHGPMILSGKFTGSGHIVTLVGQTASNDFIVHDPYGDWNTAYRNHNGKYRIYNREAMQRVLSGQGKNHKRCHRICPNSTL